jgi:hypothetical protein
MHSFLRQGVGVLLGAVLTASILVATGAHAQEPANPVTGPGTVSIAQGANHFIHYQSQLFNPNTGQPLANQTFNVRFSISDNADGTGERWSETKSVTTNVDGLFNTHLGNTTSLPPSIFNGNRLFLGVAINGEQTLPRQELVYVPYAMWARNADQLSGLGSRDYAQVAAFGFVRGDGSRASGRFFNSSRDSSDAGFYYIDIDNVDYSFRDFTTLVTPACNRPVFVGTGSTSDNPGGNDLIVDIWDRNGNRTDCDFQFMTLRRAN